MKQTTLGHSEVSGIGLRTMDTSSRPADGGSGTCYIVIGAGAIGRTARRAPDVGIPHGSAQRCAEAIPDEGGSRSRGRYWRYLEGQALPPDSETRFPGDGCSAGDIRCKP
ncbi:hypothetical protein [Streptomyces sp. IBSBF 3136]|uniref:hypothetical protein n=1 Tax=Streptomyces sp. IBSBF 3136 TaxID=2903524 RepID=UPI002FDBDDCC